MSNSSTQEETFLREQEQYLTAQIAELQKDLDAIKRVRKIGHFKTAPIEFPATPQEYNNNWSWGKKCMAMLKIKRRAFVPEIAEMIKQRQPHLDDRAIHNGVTYNLSLMFTNGEIGAEKIGNKNQYYIL